VTTESEPLTSDNNSDHTSEIENRHAVSHGVTHADVTPVVTVPPTRPDPTHSLPAEERTTPASAAKRGTRVPDDFASRLTPEMLEWAARECPLVDVRRETEAFVDYWASVPGQRGTKLDWVRTWRNRMRDQQARLEERITARPSRVVTRPAAVAWQDLKSRTGTATVATFPALHGGPTT
jgi:hypothetical protein